MKQHTTQNSNTEDKQRYEIKASHQWGNRSDLLQDGKRIAVIEHYTDNREALDKEIVTACNNYDALVDTIKKFLELRYIGNFKAGELDYPDEFLTLRMDAQILLNQLNKSK